jgi:hypothetical protein
MCANKGAQEDCANAMGSEGADEIEASSREEDISTQAKVCGEKPLLHYTRRPQAGKKQHARGHFSSRAGQPQVF